jgi:sphingosine kinase
MASIPAPLSPYPGLSEPVPESWETVEDDFVLVYSSYQTHISSDCFFAPQAKLDDGVIWLLFMRGDVSRGQILQFLTCLDSGTHVSLPFVTMVPVKVFRLEPLSREGRVTVDGELIECGPVQAEVMPSIARVMTR